MKNKNSKWILQYYLLENIDTFNLDKKEIMEGSVDDLLDMIPLQEGESSSGDWKIDKWRQQINRVKQLKEIAKQKVLELRKKLAEDVESKEFKMTQKEKDNIEKEINKKLHFINSNATENFIEKTEKQIKERIFKNTTFSGRWDLIKGDAKDALKFLKAKPLIVKTMKVGGWALLSAVVLSLFAITYYKLFLTPARRACSHLHGADLKHCLKNYKRQAIERVLDRLKQEKDMCNTSIRPDLCNRRIDEEIDKWKRKLENI